MKSKEIIETFQKEGFELIDNWILDPPEIRGHNQTNYPYLLFLHICESGEVSFLEHEGPKEQDIWKIKCRNCQTPLPDSLKTYVLMEKV